MRPFLKYIRRFLRKAYERAIVFATMGLNFESTVDALFFEAIFKRFSIQKDEKDRSAVTVYPYDKDMVILECTKLLKDIMIRVPERYTVKHVDGIAVIMHPKDDAVSFDNLITVLMIEMFHRVQVIITLNGDADNKRPIWFDRSQVSILNCFFSSPSIVNQLLSW
jgi:hypothetical protein